MTWDRYLGFLSLDVTDIVIGGELGFSALSLRLKKVKTKKDVDLRVVCNKCQSSWKDTPCWDSFFIRPDDLELYKDIFNTVEFETFSGTVEQFTTLYEIYTKDKKWDGALSTIIVGYDGEEDNRFIVPSFGEFRLNCHKVCAHGSRYDCHRCDYIYDYEKVLRDNNVAVKKKI